MMSRIKVFSFGFVFVACVALLFGWWLFERTEKTYRELQDEQVERNLSIVEKTLAFEAENLALGAVDWAQWDDAYSFVEAPNDAFIESNLNDESFTSLGVHIILFVNTKGELVYGKQVFPGEPNTREVPQEFLSYFLGKSDLVRHTGQGAVKQGILVVHDQPLLVASRPITTSDGKGDSRGSLIFARYMDRDFIGGLGRLASVRVEAYPYMTGSLPLDFMQARQALQGSDSVRVVYAQGNAYGYERVENIFGDSALLLRIEHFPSFTERGAFEARSISRKVILPLLASSILFFLVVEIGVFQRLRRLREKIIRLSENENILPGEKNDEIGSLALAVNAVLQERNREGGIFRKKENDLEKFRMAFEQFPEHIVITDPDGVILFANSAAERVTGFAFEEMQGKTPALWGKQMPEAFYVSFWETIKNEKRVFRGEITNKHKNGMQYRAEVLVVPILDQEDNLLFFVGSERVLI